MTIWQVRLLAALFLIQSVLQPAEASAQLTSNAPSRLVDGLPSCLTQVSRNVVDRLNESTGKWEKQAWYSWSNGCKTSFYFCAYDPAGTWWYFDSDSGGPRPSLAIESRVLYYIVPTTTYSEHAVLEPQCRNARRTTPSATVAAAPRAPAQPARSAAQPTAQPAQFYPAGKAPRSPQRQLQGTTVGSFDKPLGPLGNAALDKAMLPGVAPVPSQVMAQRRATQAPAERAGFAKMRTRTLHNRANDATGCLKVAATGVTTEWGIEGRYRIVNTCSYPVEASWCANTAECSSGRGNLWKIRGGGGYPIFFADLTNPEIQVGGCKAGEAKQPPLAQQPGIERNGFSEARDMPQAAPGVSLLANHKCE